MMSNMGMILKIICGKVGAGGMKKIYSKLKQKMSNINKIFFKAYTPHFRMDKLSC